MTALEWHENDAFWATLAPLVMFGDARARLAETEARLLALLVPIPAGGRVLDMGCGVGSHLLTFARIGFRVTGVDRTVEYLCKAGDDARREGLKIELVLADMRSFRPRPAFDAIVSLSTSFGFFERPSDDSLVVENFRHALKPDGVLVMDMMGKEILARRFTERDARDVGNDTRVSVERRVRDAWSWIEETWVVHDDGRRTEFVMGYRPYSAVELVRVLYAAGFTRIEVFGGYGGEPYDHNATRLLVTARTAPSC